MALRTKTIEYMLPMLGAAAGIAEGTTYTDSADTTIYIPETTSRTFKSVALEVMCHDNYLNNADPQAWSIRGSCDAGTTWTTATAPTSLVAETDEVIVHAMAVDMTAEFTARFSGASDTFRYGFYIDYDTTGITLHNVTAKLIITYEYDDAAATKIKTVRIPIDSFAASGNNRLTNTAQAVKQAATAANQLPALRHPTTPFLPEGGVTIRQAFLELWSNTVPSAVTNANLICKIDSGGAETTFGLHTGAAQSPYNLTVHMDVTTVDWTTAHELYARHNVASATYYANLGGFLIVTYEYNEATTTRLLNSLLMGFGEIATVLDLSSAKEVLNFKRVIPEENPVLKQSGLHLLASPGTTSTTVTSQIAGMNALAVVPTTAAGQAGQLSWVQRLDGGAGTAIGGAPGCTLSRGNFEASLSIYAGTANYLANISVALYLNYECDKPVDGSCAASHSVCQLIRENKITPAVRFSTSLVAPPISESDYYLMGVMPVVVESLITGSTYAATLEIGRRAAEGEGWITILTSIGIMSNERSYARTYGSARFAFKRFSGDPGSERVDIKTGRVWRFYGAASRPYVYLWATYNGLIKTINGTLTGYTGDGSGITIDFFRDDTKEYLGSATTAAGGTYSFKWLDCGIDVIGVAKQAPDKAGAFYPKAFD